MLEPCKEEKAAASIREEKAGARKAVLETNLARDIRRPTVSVLRYLEIETPISLSSSFLPSALNAIWISIREDRARLRLDNLVLPQVAWQPHAWSYL